MKRLTACVLAACLWLAPVPNAQSSTDAEQDFLYLQIKQGLDGHPESAPKHFAVGEYLFQMGDLGRARASFERCLQLSPSKQLEFLSKVYLAEVDRLEDSPGAEEKLRALKESFSKYRYVSLFGKSSKERWASPLKNDYELIESVDQLEVYKNGHLFYVIRLP